MKEGINGLRKITVYEAPSVRDLKYHDYSLSKFYHIFQKTLKQQLWSLKETSDYASATLGKVESTLKDNLEMDKHFRVQYPGYDGYNVQELQDTLSKTLDNYKHLMS